MSTVPIEITIVVGEAQYAMHLVGDPADVMFALQVGRAVSSALIEYGSRPPENPTP